MRFPLIVSVLALVLAASVRADPADFRFERIGENTALGQAQVSCLIQDRTGFLWIGTRDRGLFRFDGYDLKRFVNTPDDPTSLSDNRVWALAQDRDGSIWVGTFGGGLNRLDPESGRFERFRHDFRTPGSLAGDKISSLLLDSNGTLWIAISGKGLDRLVRGAPPSFEHHVHSAGSPAGLASNDPWILSEQAGELWIAHRYQGIDRVNLAAANRGKLRFTHIGTAEGLPTDQVWNISAARDGGVWVATFGGGLAHIAKGGAITRYRDERGGPGPERVRSVYQTTDGAVWFGTDVLGLHRWDPAAGVTSRYLRQEGDSRTIGADHVVAMLEDREHVLWIGTWGGGLAKFDPATIRFRLHRHRDDDPHSLNARPITGLAEDGAGRLWVSTPVGLNRRREASGGRALFDRFGLADGLLDENVSSIFTDRGGTLWISTRFGGLHTLSPQECGAEHPRFVALKNQPSHPLASLADRISAMTQGRDGVIWFATRNRGVAAWDGSKLRVYPNDPSGSAGCWAIFEDSQGVVWAGSEYGLGRFARDRDTFEWFRKRGDSSMDVSGSAVSAIVEDSRHNLWIGTRDGGLSRYDRKTARFEHYREKNGLASDLIATMLVDDRNVLWIAHGRGLTAFDLARRTMRDFRLEDGLQSSSFFGESDGRALKGRDGRLYFGGPGGVNEFRPETLEINRRAPPVVLTDFQLFNRSVPVAADGRLTRDLPFLRTLTLEPEESLFAFSFAALSFRRPERNRYLYRLEGFDGRWIEADARDRKAVYSNVPPGAYTFRVRASNGDGVWSETGAALSLRILPPWWQTWWFRGLLLLIFIAIPIVWVRWRTRWLEQRRTELEAVVTERTREARTARELAEHASRAKSLFVANMSHEVRTPMNAVLGLTALMEKTDLSERQREMLQRIRTSANHLLGVINDVLDLSRIEAEKLTLSREPFSLDDVLTALAAVLGSRAREKGLEVLFAVAADVPRDLEGDPVRLQQVLVNLGGNALKFTDHGEIVVSVDVERRLPNGEVLLRFSVRDTGVGIPEGELERLFESFTQLDESVTRRHGGTGLGLAISRRLVELMGGSIDARSAIGKGSTFFFTARFGLAASRVAASPQRTIRFAGGTALLVEDNAINRMIAEEMLRLAGLTVVAVGSGREALDAVEREEFDVLLMDVQMPEMDGMETTRRLKSDPRHRTRPVIALTAHAMSGDRERFLAAGMDDYVTKPIDEETLLEVIARWIPHRLAKEGAGVGQG